MNPRVVSSLRRSGMKVEADAEEVVNPRYRVSFADKLPSPECFSKVFDASPNPDKAYCAIMIRSSADDACPIVLGCDLRLPIRYEDPKISDDTPEEASTYGSNQIGREMLFVMENVRA